MNPLFRLIVVVDSGILSSRIDPLLESLLLAHTALPARAYQSGQSAQSGIHPEGR